GQAGPEAGRIAHGGWRSRPHPLILRQAVLARDAHVVRDERGRIEAGKLVPLVVEGNESLHGRFLRVSATLRGLAIMEAGFPAQSLARWGETVSAPSRDAVSRVRPSRNRPWSRRNRGRSRYPGCLPSGYPARSPPPAGPAPRRR